MPTSEQSRDYYDISPEISPQTAVFPGDTPFSRQIAMDFKKGDHLALSAITSSAHIGAHADAPSHYHAKGGGVSECELTPYFGLCQVVTTEAPRDTRLEEKHLPPGFRVSTPRVLLRTLSFPDPNRWNGDFNSLSPSLISTFAAQGVRLIGIDTPSIDPATDKTMVAHAKVYEKKLSILEGLDLRAVPDGKYELIALPLRIKDADASPVRAILVRGGQS